MANAKTHSLGPNLTRGEKIAGFCYVPVYVLVLAVLLQSLNGLLDLRMTEFQINIAYFVLNFLFCAIIFRGFLIRSFRSARFWEVVQAIILGMALYYALQKLLSLTAGWLKVELPTFNNDAVLDLTHQNKTVMLICGTVLAPFTEELLTRALIFGTVRRKSRAAAYVLSILFFSFIHVWSYAFELELRTVLLGAVSYIPAGIAFAWAYEKSDTVWTSIAIHVITNIIAFGILM